MFAGSNSGLSKGGVLQTETRPMNMGHSGEGEVGSATGADDAK